MHFAESQLAGVYVLEGDAQRDDRGTFQRIYCADEMRKHGLELTDMQSAISRNWIKGTLRGLHFIPEREGETKLIRCIRGRIFDVAVDLRPSSPTLLRHIATELSADRGNALYLPRGVAHGFITLTDQSEVLYQFSRPHRPGIELGVRWDDPAIGINWPLEPKLMSEKDRALPLASETDLF